MLSPRHTLITGSSGRTTGFDRSGAQEQPQATGRPGDAVSGGPAPSTKAPRAATEGHGGLALSAAQGAGQAR